MRASTGPASLMVGLFTVGMLAEWQAAMQWRGVGELFTREARLCQGRMFWGSTSPSGVPCPSTTRRVALMLKALESWSLFFDVDVDYWRNGRCVVFDGLQGSLNCLVLSDSGHKH